MERPLQPAGRHAAGLLAAVALLLLVTPVARAADEPLAPACDGQEATQPFLPWLDPAAYVLAPNGAAESTAGWDLEGGAARVAGNEPYHVHRDDDRYSLAVPAGASATTAPMCVGLEHPTLRFFARNRGSVLSPLRVEVLFDDVRGTRRAATIAAHLGGSSWRATPPFLILANLGAVLGGDSVQVAFRFSSGTGGEWSVDDVYVDPFRHG